MSIMRELGVGGAMADLVLGLLAAWVVAALFPGVQRVWSDRCTALDTLGMYFSPLLALNHTRNPKNLQALNLMHPIV